MRFASIAEVKHGLSAYLERAQKRREPIVVIRYGQPHALIQPITEQDIEHLEWKQLATRRLSQAWEGEKDTLYDYL